MSFKDKSIRIDDWASNILFIGDYDDPKVDKILEANECECKSLDESLRSEEGDYCPGCNHTGYKGDFNVQWVDDSDKDDCNVYEYINY